MNEALNKLLNCYSVSGIEDEVKNIIREELKEFNVKEDKMGNLIVKTGDTGERLMLCCSMDNPGLMVAAFEDGGFARIADVGDISIKQSLSSLVRFKNGTLAKIASSKDTPDDKEVFLDFGFSSGEEAGKRIKEGDIASFVPFISEAGENILASDLSSAAGCYILLNVIKNIKKINREVYFVFSAGSQFDGSGVRSAAYEIKPDCCIVISSQDSKDMPDGDNKIRLGSGPVATVMDKNMISSSELRKIIEASADNCRINLQYSVTKDLSTGGVIQKEGNGIKTAVLSFPIRYKNTPSEIACKDDINKVIELLNDIVSGDWYIRNEKKVF